MIRTGRFGYAPSALVAGAGTLISTSAAARIFDVPRTLIGFSSELVVQRGWRRAFMLNETASDAKPRADEGTCHGITGRRGLSCGVLRQREQAARDG